MISADTGCQVVYGGHGGAIVPLVNAIEAHPDLQWVYCRNEHNAATMAAAHAKFTGGLGVVISSSGPGATNMVTGLMEAILDEVSVLAITGLKSTTLMGHFEFQDVNQSQLFVGAGLPWSKDAPSASGVIPLLRDAMTTAFRNRTCTHMAIPEDIQVQPSPLSLDMINGFHDNLRFRSPTIDMEAIRMTAKTLVGSTGGGDAERNLIAVGLRALPADCYKQTEKADELSKAVLQLAEALKAPVLTRLHAKGLVDEGHPLSFGVIGVHGKPGLEAAASLVSTSECVISIGVQDESLLLCDSSTGVQVRRLVEIQPDAGSLKTRYSSQHQLMGNVVEICRLLTREVQQLSPAARAIQLQDQSTCTLKEKKEVEDALAANDAVQKLHEILDREPDTYEGSVALDTIWDTLHKTDWKSIHYDALVHHHGPPILPSHGYCHPAVVLESLSKLLVDQNRANETFRTSTICVDVGEITLWASLCLKLRGGSRTLYSEHLGTMGYGLNAAIPSILTRKEPSSAVVLVGDGAFQMTLQELATFQEHRRPNDQLLVIVFDNKNLGRVEFGSENAKGTRLSGPDYVALAKAYGGEGVFISDNQQVESSLAEMSQTKGLTLMHIQVDPHVRADMANFKIKNKALKRLSRLSQASTQIPSSVLEKVTES